VATEGTPLIAGAVICQCSRRLASMRIKGGALRAFGRLRPFSPVRSVRSDDVNKKSALCRCVALHNSFAFGVS